MKKNSIMISCYNLPEYIKSVINQTHINRKSIIVNYDPLNKADIKHLFESTLTHPAAFIKRNLFERHGFREDSEGRIVIDESFSEKLLHLYNMHAIYKRLYNERIFQFTRRLWSVIQKVGSKEFWMGYIYGKRLNLIIQLINKTVRQQQSDPLSIPIIIINYNRLGDLKKLVASLLYHKHKRIVIIDNNSTYPPLLEYYKDIEKSVTIERMDKNYGHLVFWTNKEIYKKYSSGYYVVTDSDIIPNDNLPADYMECMLKVLDAHKNVIKVGFALRIDDIPDYYVYKDKVLEKEREYWKKPIGDNLYLTVIDTTFALYPPQYQYGYGNFITGIRIAGNYTARHGGWYIDKENMTDEEIFYFRTANRSNSWKIEI